MVTVTHFTCACHPGERSPGFREVVVPDGKRHDIGLGGFPVVSLAKARRRAFDNRVSIADGRNPFAEKQADRRKATIPIFREAAEKVYEVNKPRWRNGKHTRDWLQVLVKYAFPVVGNVTVNQIGREDVLPNSDAGMDKPPGDCPETPATDSRCSALVRSSRVRGTQRRR